jgi:galactokinase
MHEYVHGIEGIANEAKLAIEKGDIQLLGKAMKDSQTLFDRCALPNCVDQLTSPKLHAIMNDSFIQEETLACKGVGSQGDGSAQLLCRNSEQQQKVGSRSHLLLSSSFFSLLFCRRC